MYTSRRFHKNAVDNNAYITVGDPYRDPKMNPFRNGKKGEKVPKPFQMNMIPQNEENGNFTKLKYQPDGYREGIKYLSTQPLNKRKHGFGSNDASKRDEFSNYIRTEQHRETIIREQKLKPKTSQEDEKLREMAQVHANECAKKLEEYEEKNKNKFSYNSQVTQYDIGRGRTTEFNPKAMKDTFYLFDTHRDKRYGVTARPVSTDIGLAAWDVAYKPPSHGGKSEVKTFADKSHLNVATF